MVKAGAEFHVKLYAYSNYPGHYQGIARLNDDDYVALSRSRSGTASGQVLIVKMRSPGENGQKWIGDTAFRIGADNFQNDEVKALYTGNCSHPGGLSVIGDYLMSGVEGGCGSSKRVYIWNVSNPPSASGLYFNVNQSPTSDFGGTSDNRANAATAVKLSDGTFVAIAGGKDNEILHFFSGSSLASSNWTLDYVWEKDEDSTRHPLYGIFWDFPNIQSWQFAVDCSSQDIYLIGTQRARIIDQTNKAYYYKVTREYKTTSSKEGWIYHLHYMGSKGDFDYQSGAANWDAGATPFITSNGDLVMYAVEKCENGDCPGGYNRIRIVQHWGNNDASCQLTHEVCSANSQCCSGVCGSDNKCDMLK